MVGIVAYTLCSIGLLIAVVSGIYFLFVTIVGEMDSDGAFTMFKMMAGSLLFLVPGIAIILFALPQ